MNNIKTRSMIVIAALMMALSSCWVQAPVVSYDSYGCDYGTRWSYVVYVKAQNSQGTWRIDNATHSALLGTRSSGQAAIATGQTYAASVTVSGQAVDGAGKERIGFGKVIDNPCR